MSIFLTLLQLRQTREAAELPMYCAPFFIAVWLYQVSEDRDFDCPLYWGDSNGVFI